MNENDRNQTNDQPEGGLFSDDYETPKRENPYLKKNREKTKPEKAPKPEKPKREKPAKVPAEVSEAPAEEPAAEASAAPVSEPLVDADDGEGYVRQRTFSDWMFEHVKLIATIATVLVVLALVLITDVVDVVEDLITQSQQADKEEITLLYVQGLSEKSTPITWSDLDKFCRDESKAEDSITWMLSVEGTSYEVWISGTSISNQPEYVYLYDMKTGDRMTIGEDNFEAFIESHS